MKNDSLLENFESFKLENRETIIGGRMTVTGYSQVGSSSYVDFVDIDGTSHCNVPFCNNDANDWFENFDGHLEGFPCN